MSKRNDWVAAVSLLRSYLTDDLALARAIKECRWADLAAAAELAHCGVDHDLALTDPALYKALRDSITKYHLRGYACLDTNLLRQRASQDTPPKVDA